MTTIESLQGQTAVITGAASGMGRAFAARFAEAGMNVLLADIEEPALAEATAAITDAGHSAVSLVVDVADRSANQTMIDTAIDTFGRLDVVCLNAGVGAGGPINDLTPDDWRWTLDVNLFGVVHGMHAALPHLLAQDSGRIIMTASVLGHMPSAGAAPYVASKYAVVGIAESLETELRAAGSGVKVSCLCPGVIRTGIAESERNRPAHLENEGEPDPQNEMMRAMVKQIFAGGKPPEQVADVLLDAIVEDRFWVFTDHDFDGEIARRHGEILDRTNPAGGLGLLAGIAQQAGLVSDEG